jgi:hypothetical protein
MKTELVPINDVNLSPTNPRVIKNKKFLKLVKSIKEFPDMLKVRPIVVDNDMVVLGGNMRLRACMEAGLKQVHIIKASDFTEEQKREFVIKDNSSFGEWDWDLLANEWEINDLSDWGLDIPASYFDEDVEPEFDMQQLDKDLDIYINNKIKQIVMYLDSDQYEYALNKFDEIMQDRGLESNTDVILALLEEYETKA